MCTGDYWMMVEHFENLQMDGGNISSSHPLGWRGIKKSIHGCKLQNVAFGNVLTRVSSVLPTLTLELHRGLAGNYLLQRNS